MGVKTLISVEEYLRTSFDAPEPDFVEGEIIPRAMPNNFHSEALDALIGVFSRQIATGLFRRPELRIRITTDRYRVADLAIFDQKPQEAVPERNPLIVVEILSPDDSHAELMRKFADYASIGIPRIWLVDPITRRFSIYNDESLMATTQLEVAEHGVFIRVFDVFGD